MSNLTSLAQIICLHHLVASLMNIYWTMEMSYLQELVQVRARLTYMTQTMEKSISRDF